MSNKDLVLAALNRVDGALCDDCLAAEAGISPRQTVFQVCSRLFASNEITREQRTCTRCGNLKKSSSTRSRKSSIGAETSIELATLAPVTPGEKTRGHYLGATDAPVALPGDRAWYWEGHVQNTLVRFLESEGWTITETADTASKAAGVDVFARKVERSLAVEVKGYPTAFYEAGSKRGQPKPTGPATQARQWFSHALLGIMLLRHKYPDAEVAVCLPEFSTYHKLAVRTRGSFERLGFGIYFVAKDGTARVELPHQIVIPPSTIR
jgi:hypothetical protein